MLVGVILGDASIKRVGLDKAFISFEQSNKKQKRLSKSFAKFSKRRITFNG